MLHEYEFVLVSQIFFKGEKIQKNTLQPKQTGKDVHAQGKGTHAPKTLNYQLDINKDRALAQAQGKLCVLHRNIHNQRRTKH